MRRLLLGDDRPPLEDVVLVLEDGAIAELRPGEGAGATEPGVRRFERHTAMPGLIDLHVHLSWNPDCPPGMGWPEWVERCASADDGELLAQATRNARACLRQGVTHVRDVGTRGDAVRELRDAIAAGRALGPEISVSSAPLTTRGGHLWWCGGEVDDDPASVCGAVERELARGCDWTKVCASGGNLTPGSDSRRDQFGAATLAALVARSHRDGRPVAAHAHASSTIERCVDAGVDTIEHCSWYGESADALSYRPELVARMVERGTVVSCTVNGRRRAWLSGEQPQPGKEDVLRLHLQSARAGVTCVPHSDAGTPGADFSEFATGLRILHERIGFEPDELLCAVTSVAARVLGIDERVGTLDVGKQADVLVVEGDPLADLAALERVAAIWKGGVRVA